MANNPFGIDPEDFDRIAREASDEVRHVLQSLGTFLNRATDQGASFLSDIKGAAQSKSESGTAEESSPGVWVIYRLAEGGDARIEEVYPTELDALRAHKTNTDPARKVRFLPYGVTVGLLDATEE